MVLSPLFKIFQLSRHSPSLLNKGKLVTRFALKEAVISGFSISSERGNGRGGISLSLNFEEFEFAVLNEEASHRVSYNINNHTTLLDGEAVPSPYVEPEGGDDDY